MELANKSLEFSSYHIRVIVTCKTVNRGIGIGLEITVDYFFHGDNRVIKWLKKSIEKFDKCTKVELEKCMKQLMTSAYSLFFFKNDSLALILFSDLLKN